MHLKTKINFEQHYTKEKSKTKKVALEVNGTTRTSQSLYKCTPLNGPMASMFRMITTAITSRVSNR